MTHVALDIVSFEASGRLGTVISPKFDFRPLHSTRYLSTIWIQAYDLNYHTSTLHLHQDIRYDKISHLQQSKKSPLKPSSPTRADKPPSNTSRPQPSLSALCPPLRPHQHRHKRPIPKAPKFYHASALHQPSLLHRSRVSPHPHSIH